MLKLKSGEKPLPKLHHSFYFLTALPVFCVLAACAPCLRGALVCSPDDAFLLTSAVDNEIKQYLAVDGRLHMNLDVPKTGLDENFTRSYYTSSGR